MSDVCCFAKIGMARIGKFRKGYSNPYATGVLFFGKLWGSRRWDSLG